MGSLPYILGVPSVETRRLKKLFFVKGTLRTDQENRN